MIREKFDGNIGKMFCALSGGIGKEVDSCAEVCGFDLYFSSSAQRVLLCTGRRVTASELDLLSLTPWFVASCGRL